MACLVVDCEQSLSSPNFSEVGEFSFNFSEVGEFSFSEVGELEVGELASEARAAKPRAASREKRGRFYPYFA